MKIKLKAFLGIVASEIMILAKFGFWNYDCDNEIQTFIESLIQAPCMILTIIMILENVRSLNTVELWFMNIVSLPK